MDVHDLSDLLHMQNQTQLLLQQLHNNQVQCRQLLDTSLSSISSTGLDGPGAVQDHVPSSSRNQPSLPNGYHAESYSGGQPLRSSFGSKVQKQELLDRLQGKTKLDAYRKVSSGDKPGRRSEPKVAQGIENNRFQFGDSSLRNDVVQGGGRHSSARSNEPVDVSLSSQQDEPEKANTSVTFHDELELLGTGELNTSSTPKRLTKPMAETPRSILKHRKIIDDNVRVESKYDHTPMKLVTPRGKHGLNYSYSGEDDLIDPATLNGNLHYSDAKDGSYIEEYLDEIGSPKATGKTGNTEELEKLDQLIQDRLMLDYGNDRANASVVRDLSQRPKSYVFQSAEQTLADDTQPKQQLPQKKRTPIKPAKTTKTSSTTHKTHHRSKSGKTPPRVQDASNTSKLWRTRDKPLLGYDWIAGNLENEGSLLNQPDEYFREIQNFRDKHKRYCAGDTLPGRTLDLSRPISPEVHNPDHKCLHGYTVNERLFTEALNADEQGQSVCPICLTSREEPTPQSPGFVRVSIPRSTLEQPYRVKPHRRRSFDATDSYALSKHCLAGYECSVPTVIPTAKNIDIKGANGIQGKQAMTLQEAENFVKSHSRKSRLMATNPGRMTTSADRSQATGTTSTLLSGYSLNSDTIGSGDSHRSRTANTTSLLNMTHSLRYDLQDLARRTGRDKHKIPHSTNYPVL